MIYAGPDLLSAGPCLEKNVGARHLRRQTLFFLKKKLATFLVIAARVCQLSLLKNWRHFFAHYSRFTRGSPIFPACKNLPFLLWGPLFVGSPVQPNMLNKPKSAAGFMVIFAESTNLARTNELKRGIPLSKAKCDRYCAITWKGCEIGRKLVLFTNTKDYCIYTGF